MTEPGQLPIDALTLIVRKLNSSVQPYMITGSVAAWFYGGQRTTIDIDIVLDCAGVDVEAFVAHLTPDFFLDPEMFRDSLRTMIMFNALPLLGGSKIDFIPLTGDSFDQVAFRRRVEQDWFGTPVSVIAGMNLVINKLRWAKDSMSARQLADVRAIMSHDVIDDAEEFARWVRLLGLQRGLDASRTAGYEA